MLGDRNEPLQRRKACLLPPCELDGSMPRASCKQHKTACTSCAAPADHYYSATGTHTPSCLVHFGSLSSALNFTNVVGTLTSHVSPCGNSPLGLFALSAISSAIARYNGLEIGGRGPPFQSWPNWRKWSIAPSKPGRAGMTTRAKPAFRNSSKTGSGSSKAMRCSQRSLLPQK